MQAEYDSVVIELAGDLLPPLASAMGGEAFAPYFAGFLPLLLARNVGSTPIMKYRVIYDNNTNGCVLDRRSQVLWLRNRLQLEPFQRFSSF